MILSPHSPSFPLQLRGFWANQKCVKITKEGERRSYGINEQRQRDIIQSLSPSHLSLSTHTLPLSLYLPLFPPHLNSLTNFVALSFFSFCLSAHASLCFFSPTNSLIIQFLSPIPPFSSPPPSFSSASAPLGSCVLVGVVEGLALCRAQSVSAALAHPSAHPAPWSLINESSVVFVYQPVIC